MWWCLWICTDLLLSLKRHKRTMNKPFSTICVAGLTTGISISSSLPNTDIFSSFSKIAERCFCKRQNKFHINILSYLLKSKANTDTRQLARCFKSLRKPPVKSDWRQNWEGKLTILLTYLAYTKRTDEVENTLSTFQQSIKM